MSVGQRGEDPVDAGEHMAAYLRSGGRRGAVAAVHVCPHVLGPGRHTVFWKEGGARREHTFDVDGRRASLDVRLP